MEHGTITNDNHSALWHGRFCEGPSADAVAFETSINVDERMALDDIEGSVSHAKMLSKTKIITESEADAIINGLISIKNDLLSGKLQIDYSAEDVHSFIEATLTDRIGEAGKKVHTGRSRNDQIALDERLYLRRVICDLQKNIKSLVKTLCVIAEKNTETIMPGFTHTQHAQPITLAFHLCAWSFMLVRDYERFSDSLKRICASPIGSSALAGSTLMLDREYEAKELGFDKITDNALDAVSDRDYCIEIASDLSILQMRLSRFSEEIVLWATSEFGFIELSEKWSTGSSIMPQKKNPDFAELIRGRTGKVYGDLISLLVMMKALPLSYNRDLQEDKESLFDALDTTMQCLCVFEKMIESATWNKEKMFSACKSGFLNATDAADYLVRKGIPFRQAHEISARAVRLAIEKKCTLDDLTLSDYKTISPLFESDIYDFIDIRHCVHERKTQGGTAKERVVEQLKKLKKFLEEEK